MRVIRSSSVQVYENLAAEDALLDEASLTEPLVFIYRNEAAVVLGKNQNPWRECAVSLLDRHGIALARRISGGGTVFHDMGNWNVSLILPRRRYQRSAVMALFVKGLARVGVAAEVIGTSLTVGGKKISGHAFCYRRDHVLHHGTLLWESDLDRLRAILMPEIPEMKTRAVASVPMPVMNLREGARVSSDDADGDGMIASLLDVFAEAWGPAIDAQFADLETRLFARKEKMQSWNWLYGATPDFTVAIQGQTIHVHRGVVASVEGHPDHAWIGRPFIPFT